MTPDLTKLLAAGESETLELKGPQASLELLGRHVCGLLNQQGGVLVWGVTDRGHVVGLVDASVRAQQLNAYLAEHIRPRPLVSATVESSDAKPVVVVDVPPGADKPYSIDQGIWIRLGASTLRATAEHSAEMVERRATQLERWERELMPGFTRAACDERELDQTRRELLATGRYGTPLPDADEDLLRFLNLSRAGRLTNACVVLFARRPREWAPHLSLRVTSYTDAHQGAIGADTILEGPAIRLVEEAITIIQQRTGFSGTFEANTLQRRDRPAYALYALREGLVNAVAHRDYQGLGDVRVEIHPDSVVVRNPGRLPDGWTIHDLRRDHVSKPVNPDIARVFHLRGFMEQLGMGAHRLVAACKELGARTPTWAVEQHTVSLTMFRAPVSGSLAPRQQRFVESRKAGQPFVLRDYARSAKVSERQARRDLGELERLGYVERVGRGPATRYLVRPAPDAARVATS